MATAQGMNWKTRDDDDYDEDEETKRKPAAAASKISKDDDYETHANESTEEEKNVERRDVGVFTRSHRRVRVWCLYGYAFCDSSSCLILCVCFFFSSAQLLVVLCVPSLQFHSLNRNARSQTHTQAAFNAESVLVQHQSANDINLSIL